MGDSKTKRSKPWKPLIHFFLLGFVVFGLKAWFERSKTATAEIRLIQITAADLDWFRTMFKKRMGRDPFAEELQSQVDQLVREQVLSREAARLGLDKNDDIVRRRLTQKMDYLFRDMASGLQPTDDELQTYLDANQARYAIPGETTFEQALFKIGDRGVAGAELALAMFLDHPTRESDATMLPRMNDQQSSVQIAGIFGSDFAKAIQGLETGKWHGPIRSGYGLHAVFIHDRSPVFIPSIDDIRTRLTQDWSAKKQLEVSAEAYKVVLNNYQVLLEGMPYDTQ